MKQSRGGGGHGVLKSRLLIEDRKVAKPRPGLQDPIEDVLSVIGIGDQPHFSGEHGELSGRKITRGVDQGSACDVALNGSVDNQIHEHIRQLPEPAMPE